MSTAAVTPIAAAPKRTLPHDLDAERAVLGSILLYPKSLLLVAADVSAADFFHPAHEAIYAAMVELDAKADAPLEPIAIAAHLRQTERMQKLAAVGGEGYFLQLSDIATPDAIEFHAGIVRAKARARRLIEAAHEIAARGYTDRADVDDLCADAERLVLDATTDRRGKGLISIGDAVVAAYKNVEAAAARPEGSAVGVPTGFRALDEGTKGGFRPSDLIVIAARPSMGKTSLMMATALGAARAKVPVLIFSLEMSATSLGSRVLSTLSLVDLGEMLQANVNQDDWKAMMHARRAVQGLPMKLDETADYDVPQIRAVARRWRAHEGAGPLALVVIDYLQLIRKPGRSEREDVEISAQVRGLKMMAKELAAPVVLLSQLNRQLESRPDKRPKKSDLRGSGGIEEHADTVAFIHRDEVHNPGTAERGIAEIIFDKQRNGPTGTVKLGWSAHTTSFYDLARGA